MKPVDRMFRSLSTVAAAGILFVIVGCSRKESATTPATAVSDTELDALADRLHSDPAAMWEVTANRREMLPTVLAAQQRSPEDRVWVQVVGMCFAADRFEASGLAPEARRDRYKAALEYLNECANTIKGASPEAHPLLEERAVASVEAGELDAARRLAREALERNTDPSSDDYGNVFHWANTVLGRAALREDDVEGAKRYLLESGKTPGSPQLDSFGPTFVLAGELLRRGEKETVLAYLDLVAEFWANPVKAGSVKSVAARNAQEHAKQLEEWEKEINEGKVPRGREWR